MAGSFEIISSVTLSANTNTLTFSSIPSNYRVLKIYSTYNTNTTINYLTWRANSGAGAFGYTRHMGTRKTNWGDSVQDSGNVVNGSSDFSTVFQNLNSGGFGSFELTLFNAWNGRGIAMTSRSGAPTRSNGLNSMSGHSQRAAGNLSTLELRAGTTTSNFFTAGSTFILYGAGK